LWCLLLVVAIDWCLLFVLSFALMLTAGSIIFSKTFLRPYKDRDNVTDFLECFQIYFIKYMFLHRTTRVIPKTFHCLSQKCFKQGLR
jgi:hypothetical protein